MKLPVMKQLEDVALWRDIMALATASYEFADTLSDDEKWDFGSPIKQRVVDLSTDVAEAFGGIDPRDSLWLLGKARGASFGLKSLYMLAQKTGVVEVNPEVMVLIKKIIGGIEREIAFQPDRIGSWGDLFETQAGGKREG